MKRYWKDVLAVVIVVFLGTICLRLSNLMMTGLEDCSNFDRITDTIPAPPRPPNCADEDTLFKRDGSQFVGIALFLVPIAWFVILMWRKNQLDKEELEIELAGEE